MANLVFIENKVVMKLQRGVKTILTDMYTISRETGNSQFCFMPIIRSQKKNGEKVNTYCCAEKDKKAHVSEKGSFAHRYRCTPTPVLLDLNLIAERQMHPRVVGICWLY